MSCGIIRPFRRYFNPPNFTGFIGHPFPVEMRRQCTLQVFFVLSLHVLSKAHYVIGSGPSCLRSSPAGLGQTRVTFLREDATGVRFLYVSLWSEDARPVTCQVNTNPTVTDRYFSVCNRSGGQGREIRRKFNTSMLLSPGSPCKLASSGVPEFIFKRARRDATEGKVVRRKRAWIFPGTLWCGTGSKADEYEQLGEDGEPWVYDFAYFSFHSVPRAIGVIRGQKRHKAGEGMIFQVHSVWPLNVQHFFEIFWLYIYHMVELQYSFLIL